MSEKTKKGSSQRAKTAIAVIAAVVIVLAIVIGACNIWAAVVGGQPQTGIAVGYEWSASDPYSEQKTAVLDMGSGDYKILVVTDIHLKNRATFAGWLGVNQLLDLAGKIAPDGLVAEADPDLILLVDGNQLKNTLNMT